jgi:glycogen debranching enzyme
MELPSLDTDPYGPYRQVLETGEVMIVAGLPSYRRSFPRDLAKAGLIGSSSELLKEVVEFGAQHQGVKYDPQTGEKPGKIHHEYPGVTLNGGDKYTTYNACDTTPLFIIAAEGLLHLDKLTFTDVLQQKANNLQQAVGYINAHVGEDNLFWENPPKGSNNYALRVTYWKDSILPQADGKMEPMYPVVFPLAHFIAARGLLSASRVLDDPSLASTADKMFKAGIKEFIRPDSYTVYRDNESELIQASSDELHALAYIPSQYADLLPLEAIQQRAQALSTPFGYMCTPLDVAVHLTDKYHGDAVWVFEQALIHYGATKFNLVRVAAVAATIAPHIGAGQELFSIIHNENANMTPIPAGNARQLWSVAAAEYFAGRSMLTESPWL